MKIPACLPVGKLQHLTPEWQKKKIKKTYPEDRSFCYVCRQ